MSRAPTARKVVPIRRRTTTPKGPPQRFQTVAKSSGFAVGVSKAHYDWITATAGALGVSRQAVMTGILNRLVQRATLGSHRKGRR